jgi:small subunit ribosomal protein S1
MTHTDDDDFEALLRETGLQQQRRVAPGERVSGTVTFLGDAHATVDLGGGLDGLLDLAGTLGKDGKSRLRVGERVDAYVLRVRGRVVELTTHVGRGQASNEMLVDAVASGVPVEGTVTGVNKGGLEVDVSGSAGFCPLGQIDLRRVEDASVYVGQRLRFRVTDVRGRDVVLSRRALLEAEQAHRAEETRRRVEVGARLPGVVTAVRDFGAFVDLGGIEGFVPASELAWGRKKPADVVEVGQTVEVEVLRIEPALDHKGRPSEKIALSMRAIAKDPFEALLPHVPAGTVLRGIVTRVEAFGAFVEILPAVEGLIHVSAFGRRVARPSDVVQPGQDIAVQVQSVDPLQRRLSLRFVPEEQLAEVEPVPPAPTQARILGRFQAPTAAAEDVLAQAPSVPRMQRPAIHVGEVHEVTVDRLEQFGVFVAWEGGRGLVPKVELGLPQGMEPRRAFPVGSKFKAVVQEVRADGKVRLSRTAALNAEERADAEEFLARQNLQLPKSGAGVGSFGELLLAKLQAKK